MKRLILFSFILWLLFLQGGTQSQELRRGLGDVNWWLDLQKITGEIRHKAVEFDGTNFWVSTVLGFPHSYLYEISPDGTLINQYPQPDEGDWRDLAWDGEFLYAGGMDGIVQIDPADGQPTGVVYGAIPFCRALAYDPSTDSFWTASYTSSLYQIFKDGAHHTFDNPGLAITGAAFEASDPAYPMLWWWSQDGPTGALASEYNPRTHAFTGKSFHGHRSIEGGLAAGAGAYPTGEGQWEFVGLYEGSPDNIAGHDLVVTSMPLITEKRIFDTAVGGKLSFYLHAGEEHGDRSYALFGSLSGHAPGTPLPGGLTTLPLNWDVLTTLLLGMNLPGFMGVLDNMGGASAEVMIPPLYLTEDLTMTFAYALKGPPWDFASNPIEVLLEAITPGYMYAYDDGSTEGSNFFVAGGEICRMHGFETYGAADVIRTISVAWGSAMYPGYCPGNGTPSTVFIWDDPNDDGDPSDCIFLALKDTVVQNVDTDILTKITLDSPVPVEGFFFIGCVLDYPPGSTVIGMDFSSPYMGNAWMGGNPGGVFDYLNLGNNYLTEMHSVGFPGHFLLRAIP
jgi:hypothetical protein